ncbi:acetyltransferase [Minicystis rosea]|nr:acetyltransferase [Minicystis rosea]
MRPRASSFIDHALAARIEDVEVVQLSALVRAVSATLPAQGAASLAVAGGVAAFVGRDISVSRAAGLGMRAPVTGEDIDALEDFYRSRGTGARIFVSPFADRSLFGELGTRGFRLDELDTILLRPIDLDHAEGSAIGASSVEVTVARPEDAAAWVAASLAGFGAVDGPSREERTAVFEAAFTIPSAVYFVASIGAAIAGTAALFLHGPIAYFFAASTLAAHRGRGVQAALIQARLAFARNAGCDLACTGAAAGSASHRNFERMGFSPAYSQALLIKDFRNG